MAELLSVPDALKSSGMDVGIPRTPRNPNTCALIGDSRAANFLISTAVVGRKSSQHPLAWAMGYMGQRLRAVYFGGISGFRSDQWQKALSPDLSYLQVNNVQAMFQTDALWAVFAGIGVNDISQGFTAAQIWNGYNGAPGMKAVLDACINAGMRPIIFGELGATGFSATQIGYVAQLNRYLRGWASANSDAIYFNQGGSIWSPTATSAIAFKAGYSGDGMHLTALGANAAGSDLSAILTPRIPLFDERITSGVETYAQGGVQLCPNPLFLTSTGGSAGTGITGTAPSGTNITRLGGATATLTVIADPNGYGNAIQLACTFAANGDAVVVDIDLTPSIPLGSWTPGDRYFAQARVEVANGSSNAGCPWSMLRFQADGVANEVYDFYNDVNISSGPTTAYNLDQKTGILTIPTYTTATQVIQRVRMNGYAAGSQTVVISRCSTTKVLN